MNRRDCMKVVGAAWGLSAWSRMAIGGTGQGVPGTAGTPMHVVFDQRYSDARAFAAVHAARGAQALDAGEDVMWLWRTRIAPLRPGQGLVVAGMTTRSDFEVLKGCAAACGLGVRYEGVHDCRNEGRLTHVLRGRIPAGCQLRGPGWAEELALGLSALDAPESSSPRQFGTQVHPGDHPGTLVSWLVGAAERPRSRSFRYGY